MGNDFDIYRRGERVFIEMDRDTAWLFAQRVNETVGWGKPAMTALYEEIYGE